jgi:nucleoside-diphosphate-sugar epimerase
VSLFVFGLGYSAGSYARQASAASVPVAGTVRTAEKAGPLCRDGVRALVFDGDRSDPGLLPPLRTADRLLVSVQPDRDGDPVLRRFESAIAQAPDLSRIVYLSTVGVYGDHAGGWVDETTPPEPLNARGRARLAVEQAWLAFGRRTGRTVSVLRLAGIYGPGRNALADLRDGDARRIAKPDQVFNRIHLTDIGRAITCAFDRAESSGVWNVTDDEPAPAPDVVAYAAALMGIAPPPEVPFETAPLSPMARSFYAANRRVSNRALKTRLGFTPAYPTYREGLDALWAAGEGR